MKSNKSYAKRLRMTKNGKIIGRGKGHNHFNAKESRKKQLAKNRYKQFIMGNKDRSRYLSGLK